MLQTLKYLFSARKGAPAGCELPAGFSTADQAAYDQWRQQKTYLNWTPDFFQAYHYVKAGMHPHYKVERINQLGKQGVVLFFDPRIGNRNFHFLHEFLKDQGLSLGYRLHAANVRTKEKDAFTEIITKYYLMPPPTSEAGNGLCNQLYGTISIDLIQLNLQPTFIRIVANSFLSCAFSPALSFDELLNHLLERPVRRF